MPQFSQHKCPLWKSVYIELIFEVWIVTCFISKVKILKFRGIKQRVYRKERKCNLIAWFLVLEYAYQTWKLVEAFSKKQTKVDSQLEIYIWEVLSTLMIWKEETKIAGCWNTSTKSMKVLKKMWNLVLK